MFLVYLIIPLCHDEIKEIYLIDKSVKMVHKDDVSHLTYHISFYYTDKTEMIYRNKKQPPYIWKQVYYNKNNSKILINFGPSGTWLIFVLISIILFIIGFVYTVKTFNL